MVSELTTFSYIVTVVIESTRLIIIFSLSFGWTGMASGKNDLEKLYCGYNPFRGHVLLSTHLFSVISL